MDKNNFDQLGFPVNDNSDDFGTTRELNSIHDADPEDPSGIAPRDRFTEMNSADDPGSTRMMDSLTAPDETEAARLQIPSGNAKNAAKRRNIQITRARWDMFSWGLFFRLPLSAWEFSSRGR